MAKHLTKRVYLITIFLLALISAYYIWAAVGSSLCTSTGISQKTRATWAPATGCVIDHDWPRGMN